MNKKLGILSLLIVVVVICGILIVLYYFGPSKNKGLSIQDIAERSLAYVNATLVNGGKRASLESVTTEAGLVKMKLVMGDAVMVAYATTDGKLFFEQGVDLTNKNNYPYIIGKDLSVSAEEDFNLSDQDLVKFNKCLKESNLVIYGAAWCFYTNSLISKLGGWEKVGSMYVDCDSNKDLCEKNGIVGYPTIFINGEEYSDSYNLTKLSEATGCLLP